MPLQIDIRYCGPDDDDSASSPWSTEIPWQILAEQAILAALSATGHDTSASPHPVIIELFLTDDIAMARLNGQFRGKPKPTNVLSFQAGSPTLLIDPATPILLGSIVLAYETCAAEALAQNKSFVAHVSHLIIHGTLHLLDYDHECDKDQSDMENIEQSIMAALNYPDPYGDS